MKHVHYEMIVAKAANFELIQFVKIGDNWEIVGSHDNKVVSFASHYEYFLCLPQHKEACLHWLNGGKVQQKPIDNDNWMACADVDEVAWMSWTSFMQDKLEFRIKPEKGEFSELLKGLTAGKPISDSDKEGLIYKLIESFYGSGMLIKFEDVKSECE